MKIFDHPNLTDFKCSICGTNDDKPVTLIGISGSEDGHTMRAEQIHVDCIDLILIQGNNNSTWLTQFVGNNWQEIFKGEKDEDI